MRYVYPRSLAGQLVALMVLVLVASQVLNVAFLMRERRAMIRAAHFDAVIDRVVDEAASLPDGFEEALPLRLARGQRPAEFYFLDRKSSVDELKRARQSRRYAKLFRERLAEAGIDASEAKAVIRRVRTRADSSIPERLEAVGRRPRRGGEGLPPPRPATPSDINSQRPGVEEFVLSVEVAPGVWLNAVASYRSPEVLTRRSVLSTVLTLFIALTGAIITARQISKPIRNLGFAAEALGRGEKPAPVPETGPQDVRKTAAAFNRMREQLTRVIEEQRVTLRAIGHDLRTPLTFLRIRAEDLPEGRVREDFVGRIDDIADMTNAILGWSKDSTATEEVAKVDVTSLVDSIVQDYVDQGASIRWLEIEESIILPCRRVSLRRALCNVIDNGLKYGGAVTMSITVDDASVVIDVVDEGPGIPEDQLENVFKPFVRLEGSRNRDTGGMGLGLSIAQSVAGNHGGALSLANRAEGGLTVSLILPRPLS